MAAGDIQYSHAEKYTSTEVKLFTGGANEEPQNVAFLIPTVVDHLELLAPGKRVLDIACGNGIWACLAAQCGSKSVDGFDIMEEMVQLAKQKTSEFSNVTIHVGDVMDMPHDDGVFDVAMSFYVTCSLRPEACIAHFKELYRVLAPGGKAMMVTHSRAEYETMFVKSGADKATVETKIESKLRNLPCFPTQEEINDAFKDVNEIIQLSFVINESGRMQRVSDVSKLTNGQAVWSKCQIMTFPDYYYDDQFFQQQIKSAGLKLDQSENYYTEERRIAYNSTNPEIQLDKSITDTPPFIMYHISKPLESSR